MSATAEMQWRSPVCRTFGSLKDGIRLPTSPFLDNFQFADNSGVEGRVRKSGEQTHAANRFAKTMAALPFGFPPVLVHAWLMLDRATRLQEISVTFQRDPNEL